MADGKYSVKKDKDYTWTFMAQTESREEVEVYMDGPKYKSALVEMAHKLRQSRKYSQNEIEAEWAATFEQMLFDIINEEGIELW